MSVPFKLDPDFWLNVPPLGPHHLGPLGPLQPPLPVDTEVRVTSETGGQKGSKLARFDLIPPEILWEIAEHYGKGAEKYEDDNWRRGYDWKYSYAALQRHLSAFWAGEDIDPETGSKHVVAAAWHCIALAWFMDNKREYDNRPPKLTSA